MERVNNASELSIGLIDLSMQYKNLTNPSFEKYKTESETYSKLAFWTFFAGVLLCLCLVFDLFIFEPEDNIRRDMR